MMKKKEREKKNRKNFLYFFEKSVFCATELAVWFLLKGRDEIIKEKKVQQQIIKENENK
jgi:hypothetical protein